MTDLLSCFLLHGHKLKTARTAGTEEATITFEQKSVQRLSSVLE